MADEKGPTPPPTQPVDKMLVIPLSLAQAVLNYLAKQPCGEVYNFVGALMNLKEMPSPAQVVKEREVTIQEIKDAIESAAPVSVPTPKLVKKH